MCSKSVMHFLFVVFLTVLVIAPSLQVQADVLRPVSVQGTLDNMLSQILSPLAKKLRELQQTYKFRYQNSATDSVKTLTNQVNSQMIFFADGAAVCGKAENHDIIGRINYQFKKSNSGWSERADYAGCDQNKISLIETIEVQTSSEAASEPARLSLNEVIAGKRTIHLQKDEVLRRYTLYNDQSLPLLSIVSFKSAEGVNLEIWFGQSKIISALIKVVDGNESFIYRRHAVDDQINFGYGNLNYRDPAEESVISRQLVQGTSYFDQLTGENISYAKLTTKLNDHLITIVASLFFRPSMENLLTNQFPTGATVAQAGCLRNELLSLEAQFRSGAVNNPTLQELLNTYFPLWRKALDSGDIVDSRALPCTNK